MTLRRYTPLRARKAYRPPRPVDPIPPDVRRYVRERDGGCVGPRIGMPGGCSGPTDPDHVRASGALGRKSRSTADNLASLCRYVHHDLKTREGKKWRPALIAYLERVEGTPE